MSLTGASIENGGRGAPTGGRILTVDRTKAFARAQRNSFSVRVLRILLPLTAAGSMVFYVAQVMVAARLAGSIDAKRPGITIDRQLTMDRPRYEGTTKDGGLFKISAVSAIPELTNTQRIKLNAITGELFDVRRQKTGVTAARGLYDSKTNMLELSEGITVVNPAGMRAELQSATINTKEGTLKSDRPVRVAGPQGTIRSDTFDLDQKTKRIGFVGGVVANLTPPPKSDAAASGAAKPASLPAFGSQGTPVDINADRLDIDDGLKTAVFSGKVRAVQAPVLDSGEAAAASVQAAGGAAAIETSRLEVIYVGQAGGAAARPQSGPGDAAERVPGIPAATDAAPGEPARIERIIVPVPLVITQTGGTRVSGNAAEFDIGNDVAVLAGSVQVSSGPDRRATAERVEFNQKADTILLTGNVVVTQAQSEVRGRRLFLDRKTGRTEVVSPAEAGLPKSRVFARLVQNQPLQGSAPAQKKAAAPLVQAAGEVAEQVGLGLTTFRTDPNAPVDIEAEKLVVEDTRKEATFSGDVRAAQGDFLIRSSDMKATYTGESGLLADPSAGSGSPGKGQAQTQLSKLEARGKVIVTSKASQQVTGDWAIFDPKANNVTIGGTEVVITQGPNIVKGSRLVIDMTTGQSIMTHQSPGVAVSGTVPEGQQQGAPTRPGRSSLTLYPSTLQKPGGRGAGPEEGARPAASGSATARPNEPKPAQSGANQGQPASVGKPSSSSWGATATPAKP